jgi:hypothetical protein
MIISSLPQTSLSGLPRNQAMSSKKVASNVQPKQREMNYSSSSVRAIREFPPAEQAWAD